MKYIKSFLMCLLLSLSFVALVTACRARTIYEGEVQQELISSDGTVQAVLTRFNGGATTAFTDRIYLKEMQTKVVSEMLVADKTLDSKIRWDGNTLVIHMPCAHIHKFSNFVEVLDKQNRYVKTIELKLETEGLCLQKFGYEQ